MMMAYNGNAFGFAGRLWGQPSGPWSIRVVSADGLSPPVRGTRIKKISVYIQSRHLNSCYIYIYVVKWFRSMGINVEVGILWYTSKLKVWYLRLYCGIKCHYFLAMPFPAITSTQTNIDNPLFSAGRNYSSLSWLSGRFAKPPLNASMDE